MGNRKSRRGPVARAAVLCALAFAASACVDSIGGDMTISTTAVSTTEAPTSTPTVRLPPGNSRSVSVPSGAAPEKLRQDTCEGLLSRLDDVRKSSGQGGVDQAVEEAIADFPGTADWAVFTEDQRHAAIDGARDAATGKCP